MIERSLEGLRRHGHLLAAHGQLSVAAAMLLLLLVLPPQPPPAAAAAVARSDPAPARTAQAPPATRAAPLPSPNAAPATKPPPVPVPGPVPGPASAPAPSPASEPSGGDLVTASGLPETGTDYRRARRSLINRGFKPARVAPPECRGPEPSVDACWGKLVEFPEIEACWGKDGSSCAGWWVAPGGKVLKIRTGGEAGRIVDLHWASQGEIDDLPEGWRP